MQKNSFKEFSLKNIKNMFRVEVIYGWIPVLIIYSNLLIKEGQGASFFGFFVIIRPKYRDRQDEGLVKYELEHAKQFYSSLGLYLMNYIVSKKYRYISELLAFVVQAKEYGFSGKDGNTKWMVDRLMKDSGLEGFIQPKDVVIDMIKGINDNSEGLRDFRSLLEKKYD